MLRVRHNHTAHDVRALRLIAALVTGGCTAGNDPSAGAQRPGATARDSAGIQIVTSQRPAWADGRGWTVDPEPVLQIGVVAGAPEHQFDRVRAVRFLSDGRLAVADEGSSQIRIFAADGRLVRAFGRRGEGPGEFPQLYGLWVTSGDTLYAQAGNVRDGKLFHAFTPDGRLVRSFTIPLQLSVREAHFPEWVMRSGEVVSRSVPQPTSAHTGRWPDSTTVLRYRADGRLRDTLARLPIFESARERFRISQRVVFGPTLAADVLGRGFVAGYPSRYELHVFDENARLFRIVRRAWTPVAITPAHRTTYRDGIINGGGERGRAVSPRLLQQRRAAMDDAVFAEQFPAFDAVRAASDGHLWVADLDPDEYVGRHLEAPAGAQARQWTVFDPAGTWLGVVELPTNFEPWDFGSDRVVGLWRDDDGVEFVRVHAIQRR